MFKTIGRSFEIAKTSLGILGEEKKLLLFPVASGAVLIAVVLSLVAPALFFGLFKGASFGPIAYVLSFAFYFLSSFIIIFFNAALVAAVNLKLEGKDPALMDGIRAASAHWLQIAGYSAISATVGLLLRMLRERGGLAGRIAAFFGGLAWALATYVAVPVLVVEGVGPIDAIKRSAAHIRRTWGHQAAGYVGFGVVQGVVTLVIFALTVVAVAAMLGTGIVALAVAAGVAGAAALLGASLVITTLSTIYQTAVYRYATLGETSGFDRRLIEGKI